MDKVVSWLKENQFLVICLGLAVGAMSVVMVRGCLAGETPGFTAVETVDAGTDAMVVEEDAGLPVADLVEVEVVILDGNVNSCEDEADSGVESTCSEN